MATNVRGPLCFVNVGLLHPGVPAQPGRGPSRATAGASVGPPPRLVPPSGRSLARPLPVPSADGSAHGNERRAETLVGRGWGQSADTGGPCEGGGPWGSGRARQHGRRQSCASGSFRHSCLDAPCAPPGPVCRAPARRRGASQCLWSFPRASPACTRPAPGEPRTRPPPAPPDPTRWRSAALRGASSRPRGPARLRQLLASEAPRHGEGHHSLSWP